MAAAAAAAGVPVVAVCGRSLLSVERLRGAGIQQAYALTDIEPDVQRCLTEAGPLLERRVRALARDWLSEPRPSESRGSDPPMIYIAASGGKSRGFHARPGSRAVSGRTNEQTRSSSASERGSGSKRDPRERSEQSNIARAAQIKWTWLFACRNTVGGRRMTSVPLFVNGEGMSGGKVHHSIEGLPFLGPAQTAPRYRFFSVRDEFPGLWPVDEGASASRESCMTCRWM